MLNKRVNQSSPEQVFVIVSNANSNTASVGHAVIWNYRGSQAGGTAAVGTGFQITHAGTNTTFAPNPGLFAGIVAGQDIAAGAFGSIQVWGHCPFAVVKGFSHATTVSSAPWITVGTTNPATVFGSYILRPLGIFGQGTDEGAETDQGYLGILNGFDTHDRIQAPGPYAVPVDGFYTHAGYTDLGTALVSLDANSTGYAKVFLRCL